MLSRRTFLRSSGVALALPLLESMSARSAFGGGETAAESPRRSVFVCTALGFLPEAFFPAGGGVSSEYLDRLARHRDRMTLFTGLSHPDQGGEHATVNTFLSAARNPQRDGFRNSVSVDEFAAARLGAVTRYPTLRLSSLGPQSQSYTASGVMLPAEHSPATLFAKLFLAGSPDEIRRQRNRLAEGRSILDGLADQSRAMRRRVGTTDRTQLDQFFESIRQAERDLDESEVWLEKPKPSVEAEQPADIMDKADLVGRVRLMAGLIPLILATDQTRILTLLIDDHNAVPTLGGVDLEHHNLSHHGRDPDKIAQLKRIETGLIDTLGDLLDGLHDRPEGDGTLLDRTSVLVGSNLGNANAHDARNLPIVVAGGGFTHGGRVDRDRRDNTPLSNLYVTLLQRMGIETDAFATSDGSLTW